MKTILADAVNTLVILGQGIDREMQSLLDSYPNRKIVLTNANDEEAVKFGLDGLPYEVFSLKHDPDKIDPAYYRTMLERLGLKVEDVVYFEHNPAAVESARSVGIQTYRFDPEKRDMVGLKAFLDSTAHNF